jgi:hypothetical protein
MAEFAIISECFEAIIFFISILCAAIIVACFLLLELYFNWSYMALLLACDMVHWSCSGYPCLIFFKSLAELLSIFDS